MVTCFKATNHIYNIKDKLKEKKMFQNIRQTHRWFKESVRELELERESESD